MNKQKKKLPDNIKIVNLSSVSEMETMDPNFFVNISDEILNKVTKMSETELKIEYEKMSPKILEIFSLLTSNEVMNGLDQKTIDLLKDNFNRFAGNLINEYSGVKKVSFGNTLGAKRQTIAKLMAFKENFKKSEVINKKVDELNKLSELISQI